MDATTTPKISLLFRAAGMMTARNMPYRPTLRALTTLAGRIFPTVVPKKVPSDQPGMAMLIIPK